MKKLLAPGLALLLASPVSADRIAVDPASIRASLESAWTETAPPGATLEILSVPALAHDGDAPAIEVSMLDGLGRPGPRAIPVSCVVGGRVVARGLANVVIRVRRPVWIARAPFSRGQRLDPAQLIRDERFFEREPRPLFAPAEDRAYRLNRDVEAGAVLRSLDVTALPEVEAGSEVLLVSRAGQAEVAVVGRTRRAGDVGDTILVHNPLTGTLVTAVLVDRGTALLTRPERGGP